MKYVALLSGGKDSCFNLLHCSRNGHDLVAAASLGPEQGKEELDSYLYQTVGQDAVELVAQALDVPLYRKLISGSAVEQGSEYGSRDAAAGANGVKGDETEDLHGLLSEVRTQHPDIQGVAVGAILSNYQRVRVEHVCHRLSLTPLCYLWQRDQEQLLSEMIHNGVEAILIKVAGIGLMPKHLGRTLAEMQPTLKGLNELYGAHICGEGGEYETLTLDCPMFKRRIVLKDVETVIHSDNDFATVAYLRIKDAFLEAKETSSYVPISVPPLLSKDFRNLETVLTNKANVLSTKKPILSIAPANTVAHCYIPTSSLKSGKWIVVSNVQLKETAKSYRTIAEEVVLCFELLRDHLAQFSLSLSNLTFVNIFVSDMSAFPEVNQAYKSFFGTSPPARACVAVDLPPDARIRLDCVAFAEEAPDERRALHVQSLSYWAPANIGPYSQAVVVGDRIFISGQIGMQPSTLTLPEPANVILEAALAFQHVHKILAVLRETYGRTWRLATQCLLCWLTDVADVALLQKIGEVDSTYASVPTLFVGAKSLPKGAQLEIQVIAHTGQYIVTEDSDTEVRQCKTSSIEKCDLETAESRIYWEVSTFTEVSAFCAILAAKGDALSALTELKTQVQTQHVWCHTYSVRLFYKAILSESVLSFVTSLFSTVTPLAITDIPVRFIATTDADDWDFALCLVGSTSDSAS
ncbi:hypothetical protein DFH11DRAFT_1849706 [Phellopilus nigrolimitatus]|nr:hypothetical protein DFH11DRAFT_1849706 [Phellopilus nigrolimitatus]